MITTDIIAAGEENSKVFDNSDINVVVAQYSWQVKPCPWWKNLLALSH